jgi:hypothetical protein
MYGEWPSVIPNVLMLALRHILLKACADIFLIELYDPVTLMFFFRNKHMMCDFGTGNNNKLNWVLEDKQELIDIIETIYRGAKKGRGLVVSPKGELNICLALERMADFRRLLHEIPILMKLLDGDRPIGFL